MLSADPSLLDLRTSQGDYAERPPRSFHIYQWTIGPNLSPMQVAAKFDRAETLAAMERFATPEQRLMLACHHGDSASAHAIVASHPGIVARLAPTDRRALADEAWAGNTAAVELMLALGFDPLVLGGQDGKGGTALHNAAWQGWDACVAALLRHPALKSMLTIRDGHFDRSPTHWCVHGSANRRNPAGDYPAILRMLFDAGAPLEPEVLDFDDAPAEISEIIAQVSASRGATP